MNQNKPLVEFAFTHNDAMKALPIDITQISYIAIFFLISTVLP